MDKRPTVIDADFVKNSESVCS